MVDCLSILARTFSCCRRIKAAFSTASRVQQSRFLCHCRGSVEVTTLDGSVSCCPPKYLGLLLSGVSRLVWPQMCDEGSRTRRVFLGSVIAFQTSCYVGREEQGAVLIHSLSCSSSALCSFAFAGNHRASLQSREGSMFVMSCNA